MQDCAHQQLIDRGIRPLSQILDNEASNSLCQHMWQEDIDYQLTPCDMHHCNAAEKAIQTSKDHCIADIASFDRERLLRIWDRCLLQAELTLNSLRPSCTNLQLSDKAQVNGAFDCNHTPLAHPGTRMMICK